MAVRAGIEAFAAVKNTGAFIGADAVAIDLFIRALGRAFAVDAVISGRTFIATFAAVIAIELRERTKLSARYGCTATIAGARTVCATFARAAIIAAAAAIKLVSGQVDAKAIAFRLPRQALRGACSGATDFSGRAGFIAAAAVVGIGVEVGACTAAAVR